MQYYIYTPVLRRIKTAKNLNEAIPYADSDTVLVVEFDRYAKILRVGGRDRRTNDFVFGRWMAFEECQDGQLIRLLELDLLK